MYTDVLMFMLACDQGKSEKDAALYFDLIKEEFQELIEANDEKDEVETLDACMDLIWVVLGYCIAKGYNVSGAWREVSDSNLGKIDPYSKKVLKNENGKVMKPKDWRPPNLKPFV